MTEATMRITVVIATIGRAAVVRRTVDHLLHQRRRPDGILVVSVTPDDVAGVAGSPARPEIVLAPRGLCAQRNAALDRVGSGADVILFLDDDFLPADDYLAEIAALFASRPDVVGATGRVIADGIGTTGFDFDEALRHLAEDRPPAEPWVRPAEALYGCNMAVRVAATEGLRFDEALPLYGWLEDIDFTYRLARRGALIRSDRFAGVHMGVQGGRTLGVRLGYSQIANPVHLLRKRSAPPRLAWTMMARNLLANTARSLWPEPHIDRAGRLRGNLLALAHLARGRLDPRHILRIG